MALKNNIKLKGMCYAPWSVYNKVKNKEKETSVLRGFSTASVQKKKVI